VFYRTDQAHGLPHNPFTSCVVPRPIAWVSSIHPSGAVNLAPFSFFNAIASNPPMVMISFNGYHEHGGEKDTLFNIRSSGEFVVNMVALGLVERMNETSAPVGHDINEVELAGLEVEASELVRPPRVKDAPIHLECRFYQEIKLPCTLENSINSMIMGHVLGIHIKDDVLSNGLVDHSKIKPVSRLGYLQYAAVNDIFEIMRPGAG